MDNSRSRYFLGREDREAIIVNNVFAGSPIVISSWLNLVVEWENAIVFQGPENHLEFLYPYLVELVKKSEISVANGTWTGVKWAEKDWLNLFFQFGFTLRSTIELLEYKLRRDIVKYCNIKLSEKAVLSVIDNDQPLVIRNLEIPDELPKNGTIEFPNLIIAPSNATFH